MTSLTPLSGSGYIEDFFPKLPEQEQVALVENLKPKGASECGFLGPDEDLIEVVNADISFLASKEVTFKQVADRINGFIDKFITLYNLNKNHPYVKSLTDCYFVIEKDFLVKMTSNFRGFQQCPFEKYSSQPCSIFRSSSNYVIKDIRTGKILHFAGLIPHLLEDHHFCEGPQSCLRFDIKTAIEMLRIERSIDYKVLQITRSLWRHKDTISLEKKSYEIFRQALLEPSFRFISSTDGKVIYVLANADLEMKQQLRPTSLLLCPIKESDLSTLSALDFVFVRAEQTQLFVLTIGHSALDDADVSKLEIDRKDILARRYTTTTTGSDETTTEPILVNKYQPYIEHRAVLNQTQDYIPVISPHTKLQLEQEIIATCPYLRELLP